MKRTITVTLTILAASALTSWASNAQALYDKECARCHGKDGKGNTTMGKKTGAKDYTDPKVQAEMTDEQAFKSIKHGMKDKAGKTLMKAYDNISDADIKALIAYMRTFKK
jgi:mono/diheme cytochrome c family protein